LGTRPYLPIYLKKANLDASGWKENNIRERLLLIRIAWSIACSRVIDQNKNMGNRFLPIYFPGGWIFNPCKLPKEILRTTPLGFIVMGKGVGKFTASRFIAAAAGYWFTSPTQPALSSLISLSD